MEIINIENAKICFPGSSYHGQTVNIRIENGILVDIGTNQSSDEGRTIRFQGLTLTPGFFDLAPSFGEPGYEDREGIANGLRTAAAGGFTEVLLAPDTSPAPDQASVIRLIQSLTPDNPVQLHLSGNLTEAAKGLEISEYFELWEAGVKAFGEADKALTSADLFLRALEYTHMMNAPVFHHPNENTLGGTGMVHQGHHSTRLGLKSTPALSEKLGLIRDLELAILAQRPLIAHKLSTPDSIEILNSYKKKFKALSCSVSVANLAFDDSRLLEFNSEFKFNPHLRSEEDKKAILKMVLEGSVDILCSDHRPGTPEEKEIEFDKANYGSSSLQTAVLVAIETIGSLEKVVETFAINPRKHLQISLPEFEIGKSANLCLIQTGESWQYRPHHSVSKSKYDAYHGLTFQNRILGIIHYKHLHLNS